MSAYSTEYQKIRVAAFAAADAEDLAASGHDPRRQAILNLVERGATAGEREAARAALERIDADLADEADYEEALAFGEA